MASSKFLSLHRLGEKVDRAGFHGAHAFWNIALAGEENDRPLIAAGREDLLQRQAVEARHRDIEYGAAGDAASWPSRNSSADANGRTS